MSAAEIGHLVLAAAHVGIAVGVLRHRRRAPLAAAVILSVAGALAYDNLVLASGGPLGTGDTLRTLNVGRFVLHAVLTPVVILASVELACAHGVRWARRSEVRVGAVVLVVVMALVGLFGDVAHLTLEAATEGGVVRYRDVDGGAPTAAIVAVLVAIVAGAAIRRAGGPSALLIGASVMFLGSAVDPMFATLLVGNTAEVVLLVGSLATLHAVRDPGPAPSPSPSRGDPRVAQP